MSKDNHNHSASLPDSAATTQIQIRNLATLPPLPYRLQKLLQMLIDPDLDMLRLVELVEQTPALAARLLGVANSAFFSVHKPARHVPDAIIRVLGLNLVRDLSLSFVLNQPFDLDACRRFDPIRFWINAMESAVLTQLLASSLPLQKSPNPATAYLAGLLHNLGLLGLVHVAPEVMNTVFRLLESDPGLRLSALERRYLGLDHANAGAELAVAWQLPAELAAAMGPLDRQSGNDDLATMVSLVALCGLLINLLHDGAVVEQASELKLTLRRMGIRFDAWPELVGQWHERTDSLRGLAVSFAGSRQ